MGGKEKKTKRKERRKTQTFSARVGRNIMLVINLYYILQQNNVLGVKVGECWQVEGGNSFCYSLHEIISTNIRT
jgi:hypothetical protein